MKKLLKSSIKLLHKSFLNFFIKIKIQYRDGSKINLGESISTILISDLGEKN